MSELIDKIRNKLQDLYPQFDLTISTKEKSRCIIYISGKKINEFNPVLLEKELEFLKDRPDYLDLFLQAIKEPIDKYAKKLKRGVISGKNSRGLTLQQIQEATANTKSCLAASRYLNVSYPTFKKYASMYVAEDGLNLFQKHLNQSGKGLMRGTSAPNLGRFSLQDIFDGKAAKSYPKWRLKMRLIKHSVIEEKCAICGFDERRVSDYKVPLEMDFLDGDETNRKLENLRLLCYNCYFLNTGDFFWRTKRKAEYKKSAQK